MAHVESSRAPRASAARKTVESRSPATSSDTSASCGTGSSSTLSARTLAKAGWLNVGQRVDARAHGRLEPGHGRDGGVESEEFEGGAGVVEQAQAIAENVGEAFGVPGDESRRSCGRRSGG